MKNLLSGVLIMTLLLSSCGPRIYKSAGFDLALAKHKKVAILPAVVDTRLRPAEMKRLTQDQIASINEKTGFAIQEKMYSWLLRRSKRFGYTVEFQDVSQTNSLLKQAGISYESLASIDRKELAGILGVDALLQNRSNMDKPMSEGLALGLGLTFGLWGSTNTVETTNDIHDGKTGNLLWKYNFRATGTVGSSPERLVNALMRNTSRKFPYNTRKA